MQESAFCVACEVGDECVGEEVRGDVQGRGFEIGGDKENLKLSLGRKGEYVY